MPSLSSIHHVALTVSNCEASIAWYQSVLGLEVAFHEPGDERLACVLLIPGTTTAVGLVQHGSADDHGFDPARIGLDHAAFTVASRDELDGWATRLSELGIEHSGVIDVPPGAILNFKDPDGIALALFWDRS